MRICPRCGERYADPHTYCPNDGVRTVASDEPLAPLDPLLGQIVDGRYAVEARIGEGGMGVVYRARQIALNKPIALKMMRSDQAHDADVVRRFIREARASSAIGHPNIVDISDFGANQDGSIYFAMEYLQGQSLAEAMLLGPLAHERALSILIQIASALEAAHASGIIHRDLKPDNVFLTREPGNDDFVKVLDFGIAKVKNAAAKLTRTGMVFGTPHYMSPEQAAGQTVDQRSDIYSLGVIMYQMFAGQLPFDADSFVAVLDKHRYETPSPPSAIVPALRETIEPIILRALQKNPEARQPSMLALREDLERALRGDVPASPSLAPQRGALDDEPVSVPKRRSSLWVALLLFAVALGIAAASFAFRDRSSPLTAPLPSVEDAGRPPPSAASEPVPDPPAPLVPAKLRPKPIKHSKEPARP